MNQNNSEAAATSVDEGWEWAIVEIFGHRRHVGKAREEERFGAKMLRIDVPKISASSVRGSTDGVTWSTHYYGGASVFSYTVTDEKTAMNYAERSYTPAIPYRDHGDEVAEDDIDGGDEEECR